MREVASIQEKTSDLIETIKNSFVYIEYHSALKDLQDHPDLKKITDDYRKEKYKAYHTEEPVSFEVLDKLEARREKLAEYPQIDRFLKAELALGRVWQEIQNRVIEAMCFD